MKSLTAVDLFCGAGGFSTGLYQAAQSAGRRVRLIGVNHWQTAIETYANNHPDAELYCESLDSLDPRKIVRGKLDLLIASPECTHHSIARGGKPINDQSRATAWHVLRWAEALSPRAVIVENVREFQTWGPLCCDGRPMKRRKGETYQAFLAALRSLGYRVESRILNAADYGDATTRERLFIIATRGRAFPRHPDPTHAKNPTMFGERRWRPAREIIDWSLKGTSIFDRARPLKPATLARIEEGIRRYWNAYAEPFLVILRNNATVKSMADPLPTITAGGGHIGICAPFLIGQQSGATPRSVDSPVPTVSTAGAISLIEPFLVKYNGNSGSRPITEPLDTISTRDRFALVEGAQLDILFRMLQPHELAAAMSFPAGYRFAGNKTETVRQIGNAVPVRTAQALISTMIN